ncbi:hypothetical protein FRC01_000617, partial [Tulasnella sp. 417]
PGPATHSVEPPKGTWIVSYVTGYDDETLFNIRTRRPLNGTARLVTRQVITYVALDEFAGSPISEDDDASIATQVYGAVPHSLGLAGFPGLELGSQVHGSPLGTMIAGSLASSLKATHGRTCLSNTFSPLFESGFADSTAISPDCDLLASTFGPLPLTKLSLSVAEPCGFKAWTSEEVFKWCGFLGAIVETFLGTVLPILVTGYAIAFLKAKSEYSPDRLLTPEESLTFRRTHGLSFGRSPSSATSSPESAPLPTHLSALDSEFNKNYDRILSALEERLNRDKKLAPANPPFLSPAWAERQCAGTSSTQIAGPACPRTVNTSGIRSSSWRVPFGYDCEPIRKTLPRATLCWAPMPSLAPGSDGFEVLSAASTIPLTCLPNLPTAVAPAISPEPSSSGIVDSNSVDAAEKNRQDPTPLSEPNELKQSDAILAGPVSVTISHARVIGTSRTDASSHPDQLPNVQPPATNKKDPQTLKPSEPQRLNDGLSAAVSVTASSARFIGASRPEVSSIVPEGRSAKTITASQALKSSTLTATDADLPARVSETASRAGLLAPTGFNREAGLASSMQSQVIAQPNLNVLEEIRGRSGSEIGGGTAQPQATFPHPVNKVIPGSFTEAPNSPANLQPQCSTDPRPEPRQEAGPLPYTTVTTVKSPADVSVQVANGRTSALKTPGAKRKQTKSVTFAEQVQVRKLPMSKEDREARSSIKPTRTKGKGTSKSARDKGKQPERDSESGMESVPTLASTPALVNAQDPGNDLDEQGFSKSEQQRVMEESKKTAAAASLPSYGGAGTSRGHDRPFTEDEWAGLEAFQAGPSSPTAVEQPQAPVPMDVDVNVVIVPSSVPVRSPQRQAAPMQFHGTPHPRGQQSGTIRLHRYNRRHLACFGF